ncbi:MAG: alpha/beta hydrolase-fold protein, partial [Acidobacteriota bacterium]
MNNHPAFRVAHLARLTPANLINTLLLLLLVGVPALGQGPQTGSITYLEINSTVLGEKRNILVRTPAGYETNKQSYPVLYLTDGDAHISHTSATVEFLARNGRMSEMIVVGIPNTDRARDLSPTRS